jgi:DNA-binding response OmpR family regulator
MRILLAEDDEALAGFLRRGLEEETYALDVTGDGTEARYMVQHHAYDLLVLDLNLPRTSGFELLKHIRSTNSELPILIISGRSRVEDRVQALDAGADDYLTKPFSFSEFSARLRALLRRRGRPQEAVLRVEDLELDRVSRTVHRSHRNVELTPREFALLEYLMLNSPRRVTRSMLIEHVWNLSFATSTNVVEVYVNYLRKKIDEGFDRKLIRTIRGVGYQIGGGDEETRSDTREKVG